MAFIARNLNAKFLTSNANVIGKTLLKSGSPSCLNVPSSRSTFILRRRTPTPPGRLGEDYWFQLKAPHFEYILEVDQNTVRLKDVQFVLKTYVEDVGQKGDVIWMHPLKGYERLILPGLADFATPENLEKASKFKRAKVDQQCSTITAPEVKRILEFHTILKVPMNLETPWTIEPWHIRVACRQHGIMLGSNDCVEIPRKIEGPNINWEGREFYVIIKINNFERATLRCRLHHWSTSPFDRLPWESDFWSQPADRIFPEDEEILSKMPLPPPKRQIKDEWA